MDIQWNSIFVTVYRCSSSYLIVTIIVSIVSVMFVWFYEKPNLFKRIFNKKLNKSLSSALGSESSEQILNSEIVEEDAYPSDTENVSILKRIKLARQHVILNKVKSNMTEEQLDEEKRVEKAQLNALFSLLKEKEDVFKVKTMEDVEEQLSLYSL